MSERVKASSGFVGGFELDLPISLCMLRIFSEEDDDPRAPVLRPEISEWCVANLAGRYGTVLDYEKLTDEEGKVQHGGITFIVHTMVIDRIICFEFEKDMIHFKMMWIG